MPKKTRQEKLAAALRRLKQQVGNQQTAVIPTKQTSSSQVEENLSKPPTPKVDYRFSGFEAKKTPSPQPTKAEEHYNYTYVRNDLVKISLLTAAAVALEIALSLTSRTSFAKLFLRTFGLEI